jgi:lysyl-tRNA synthetase class I
MNDLATLSGYLYIRGLIEEDYNYDAALSFTRQVSDCLDMFVTTLNNIRDDQTEEEIMAEVYEAGKLHFSGNLRLWFRILYQILMKEENGPRLGQFIKIFGVDNVLDRVHHVRMNGYWRD